VARLHALGANINAAADDFHNTALSIAVDLAMEGNGDTLARLRAVDSFAVEKHLRVAVRGRAYSGESEAVAQLHALGADINAAAKDGENAFELAALEGHSETVARLRALDRQNHEACLSVTEE
jgi:ankyrin repeat protein